MSIDINTLEKATLVIFQYLRDIGVDSVDLEEDFYWDIDKEQRYDPYKEPTEMDLGQLSDDWEEIKGIASGDRTPIGYSLVWVAALYRYIGETTPG